MSIIFLSDKFPNLRTLPIESFHKSSISRFDCKMALHALCYVKSAADSITFKKYFKIFCRKSSVKLKTLAVLSVVED
jgi:hypothetical protein